MGITRTQLIDKVKRRLGAPMVKVELCDEQIVDHIDYARTKYIKWAIGNSTQEVYFTILLQAGKKFYDLPAGVTEVVQYMDDPIKSGGINTLFTIDNFMFTGGYFGNMFMGGYDIVSYHLVLDFMTTLSKYRANPYNWKYHKSTNQIEINPPPAAGKTPKTVIYNNPETGIPEEYMVDSPGWVLLKTYMIEGSTLPSYTPDWRDVLKEKKTIIEQRGLSSTEIFNRRLLLEHTPYNNTEQEDRDDVNLPEDTTVVGEGKVFQQYTDWWFHPQNKRVIMWGDDMAQYITDTGAAPFGITVSYPVVYNSEYYPDEWEDVTATSNEVDGFTVTQDIADKGYLRLRKPVYENNISLVVNGYTKQFGVDYTLDEYDKTLVKWQGFNYNYFCVPEDKITVTYVTVTSMKPSNAGSLPQTTVKQYTTKIQNVTITQEMVDTKSILLSNTVSVGDGMKVSISGSNRIYALDFIMLGDRKTLSWNVNGTTINPTVGEVMSVTYTSATPIMSEVEESLYESDWIIDYVTAMSKISLGLIRRKFGSFSSMGNSGISLDGDNLVSEGQSEKELLEQTLRDEESYEGYGVYTG